MKKVAEPDGDDAEVHRVVFGEHEALRARLDEIDHFLTDAGSGHGQAFVEARVRFRALLAAFLKHLENEEALLVPILKTLDSWGPVRLAQLQAEHMNQRALVAELAALDSETTAAHWAALMRRFSAELRDDMLCEEHDFIFPNAVRAKK